MPASASIVVAAIAMPNSPANRNDSTMPKQITMTGNAVASIDTASPWSTLVPCPVVDDSAMLRTGRYSVAV